MHKIIAELNEQNGSNHKIAVLKKYSENELLKRLLKMTYDKVDFTYGITMKNVSYNKRTIDQTLEDALDMLELQLASRMTTGNAALELLGYTLSSLSDEDADIIIKVIKRDLRINMGRSNINKVFKNLITKPVYCRCDIFTTDKMIKVPNKKAIKALIKDHERNLERPLSKDEIVEIENAVPLVEKLQKGTANNITLTVDDYVKANRLTPEDLLTPEVMAEIEKIKPKAIVQLKADGTYREFSIFDGAVNAISRSGEAYSYPALEKALSVIEDGYMTGELTVRLDDALLNKILPKLIKSDEKNDTNDVEKIKTEYTKHKTENREYILPRSIGNGLINSDDVPYDNLVYEVWDFITPEDYVLAGLKDKKNPPKVKYIDRFNKLIELVKEVNNSSIQVIDHLFVRTLKEATDYTSKQMKLGLEGAILKDFGMIFKDGTSNQALKLKIKIDAEVRCTGYIEGTPGTKRELTFGSLTYQNDEGTIIGSVSGFNDSQLEEINNNRNKYIGKVFTIEFNDLTQGRGNAHYALSHPRFIEFRDDKDETDTLERCLEMKDMAMNLS